MVWLVSGRVISPLSTFRGSSLHEVQVQAASCCRQNSRLRQPGLAWPSLAAPSNKTINPLHPAPSTGRRTAELLSEWQQPTSDINNIQQEGAEDRLVGPHHVVQEVKHLTEIRLSRQ